MWEILFFVSFGNIARLRWWKEGVIEMIMFTLTYGGVGGVNCLLGVTAWLRGQNI